MAKAQNDVLNALLNTEETPELDVPMTRFGVNFRVKSVGIKAIKNFQMQATHIVGKTEILDEELFASLVIAEASVVPDWKDPQLMDKYATKQAHEIVSKRLLDGEKAYLAAEIMTVSGFNQEARIRELKN